MKTMLIPLSIALLLLASVCHAQVPAQINYQGQVTDALGVNLPTGTYTMHFRVYDAATGGTLVWGPHSFDGTGGTGKSAQVPVVDGFFNVILGPQDTASRQLTDAFNGATRYIEITVGANPAISPRQQILSAPFALKANQVVDGSIVTASFANTSVTGAKIANTTITSGNLADGSVTSAKILDGTIATADLADGSVTSAKILDGTIATADLADGSVTGAKIASSTIATGNLADGSVTSAKILDGTITNADIANVAFSKVTSANADITIGLGNTSYSDTRLTLRAKSGVPFLMYFLNSAGSYLGQLHENGSFAVTGAITSGGILTASSGITMGNNTSISNIDLLTGWDDLRFRPTSASTLDAIYISSDGRIRMNGPGGNAAVGTNIMLSIGKATNGNSAGDFSLWITGGSAQPGGGSWGNNSDERLKKNIQPVTGSLEKLMQLRSVSYQYNEIDATLNDGVTYLGFIAQEVEKTIPSWVSGGPNGYKMLSIKGFEALTVQALRELRAEKDAQLEERDARIASLEEKVADLEKGIAARLAALEKAAEHPVSVAQ